MLGASTTMTAPIDWRRALGPLPSREDIASAFFLGGVLLPLSGAASPSAFKKGRSRLSLFDPIADRLLPLVDEDEDFELPFAPLPDEAAIDWHVVE
jgi:hypothetical protein